MELSQHSNQRLCNNPINRGISSNTRIWNGGEGGGESLLSPSRLTNPIILEIGNFKENLPIKGRCDMDTIPENIVAEVKLNRKTILFVLPYCHRILSSAEFFTIYRCISRINLLQFMEILMQGRHFLGKWHRGQRMRVFNNSLMSTNLDELYNEPTYIRNNSSPSCIDILYAGVLHSLGPRSRYFKSSYSLP